MTRPLRFGKAGRGKEEVGVGQDRSAVLRRGRQGTTGLRKNLAIDSQRRPSTEAEVGIWLEAPRNHVVGQPGVGKLSKLGNRDRTVGDGHNVADQPLDAGTSSRTMASTSATSGCSRITLSISRVRSGSLST